MEPAKEYKSKIVELEAKNDEYAKVVGQLTVEKDWAVGKLKSLDLSNKKEVINRSEHKAISVLKQCKLI